MSRTYNLICRLCNINYIGTSAKFNVCDECRKPITVQCEICHKDILLNDYQMRQIINGKLDKDKVVCSVKCKNSRMRQNGFDKICKSCNEEFHTKSMAQTYCESCLESRSFICPVCGEEFETSYRQTLKLIKNEPIVCSERCSVVLSLESYYERTGFHNPSHNEEVVQKRRDTYYEKTGYEQPFSNPKVQKKIIDTNLERYGVPHACMTENCRNSSSAISKINRYYFDYFDCDRYEYRLGNYSYDLFIEDNILIEINPTYTHNSTIADRWSEKPLPHDYHYNKTIRASEEGYRCIHVFDWDNEEKIKHLLTDKSRIYARKCDIREVDMKECNKFLNKYHLQGTVRSQIIRLGLYHDDELISVMTFGRPRYNRGYEYELLRLCSHKDYRVIGGSEKLFKHFIINYSPTSIISYCDNSKFSGGVYTRLNMELLDYGKPTAHWYNPVTSQHITNNLLLSHGFDRLVGSKLSPPEVYGKGTDNNELMIKHGFVQIYDCGQSSYGWTYNKEV